jgi:DNA-binding response OmpR family regulator
MAKVLVIDDDADFADAVARVVQSDGHEVETVLETDQALPAIREYGPDLIVLDVMFPENSSGGFELAREIRESDEQFEKLPILMLTAINTAFSLGFSSSDIDEDWLPVSDFIEKPVDFDVLLSKVNSLLEQGKAAAGE